MALLETRAQPCDAAYGGRLFSPCTAIPPLKYFGRHSSPSGEIRRPSIWRLTLNLPDGVTATDVTPCDVYCWPEPVDVLRMVLTTPLSTIIRICLDLLISMTCPLFEVAFGRTPLSSA